VEAHTQNKPKKKNSQIDCSSTLHIYTRSLNRIFIPQLIIFIKRKLQTPSYRFCTDKIAYSLNYNCNFYKEKITNQSTTIFPLKIMLGCMLLIFGNSGGIHWMVAITTDWDSLTTNW